VVQDTIDQAGVPARIPSNIPTNIQNEIKLHTAGTSDTLNKLEENFRQLDERNAELAARNIQLSIIREIALGIDNVRTVDQVLELVVEKARDIPGIRFAMVFELDEKTGITNIPYYSKARDPISKELQAFGFDPEIYLGRNPTNRAFVVSLNKVGMTMDMVNNPRVVIKEHLHEFTGQSMPRRLSDTIQRVLRVKSIALVPIIIDSKLRASMVFFLTDHVQTEIMEMVAAHCATALKNVQKAESLEKKNHELLVINAITNRISFLQGLEAQLNGALDEIIKIFSADGASVHLLSADGRYFDLAAQYGMPEAMIKISRHFPKEHSLTENLITSSSPILIGDMAKLLKTNPAFKNESGQFSHLPYINAKIVVAGQIRGVIFLVRYTDNPFNDTDASLFTIIANQISMYLENSRLQNAVSTSEERLNRIFQSTVEGIIEIDLNGRIKRVNQAVVRMHGYQTCGGDDSAEYFRPDF
jgi:GAF domain-containing protein